MLISYFRLKTLNMQHFTDLLAWKESHQLVLLIYKLSQSFPKGEIYGIINQIRRAAVSISSKIAEGFGRQSIKEKIQFYYLSIGSLNEVENLVILARNLKYISDNDNKKLIEYCIKTRKILSGLINSTRRRL